jgi:hypothetical protein
MRGSDKYICALYMQRQKGYTSSLSGGTGAAVVLIGECDPRYLNKANNRDPSELMNSIGTVMVLNGRI